MSQLLTLRFWVNPFFRLADLFAYLKEDQRFIIYLTTFFFNFTAIAHEANFATVGSYLYGNTAEVIGILLGSVFVGYAIGASLLRHVQRKELITLFIVFEVILVALSSYSIILVNIGYALLPNSQIFMYGLFGVISVIVGFEDAVLMKLALEKETKEETAISREQSFAGIGSAAAGFLFGTVLIGIFGSSMKAALWLGLIDALVVFVNILIFKKEAKYWLASIVILAALLLGIMTTLSNSAEIDYHLTNQLYDDPVTDIYNSNYGQIVLTREGDGHHRLFINGGLQFNSRDEVQYHEPLVHPAMSLALQRTPTRPLDVLIIGGGDGLATRDILRYGDRVNSVTVIDLHPVMTQQVAITEPVVIYNQGSFLDQKVRVLTMDAIQFARDPELYSDGEDSYGQAYTNNPVTFDVIIIDLVDPENDTASKLYTREFYLTAQAILNRGGVLVTQSTSPYYSADAFWLINLTLQDVFGDTDYNSNCFNVLPYRWQVPSFGDWGWNMTSDVCFNSEDIDIDDSLTTWLPAERWQALIFFGKDQWQTYENLRQTGIVNTLSNEVLSKAYTQNSLWDDWGD